MSGLLWMILIDVSLTSGGILLGHDSSWGYVLIVLGALALGWMAAGYDSFSRWARGRVERR